MLGLGQLLNRGQGSPARETPGPLFPQQNRFGEMLQSPAMKAALLQYAASAFGGRGMGSAFGDALGAAGRQSSMALELEQQQAAEAQKQANLDRDFDLRQKQFELNAQTARRVGKGGAGTGASADEISTQGMSRSELTKALAALEVPTGEFGETAKLGALGAANIAMKIENLPLEAQAELASLIQQEGTAVVDPFLQFWEESTSPPSPPAAPPAQTPAPQNVATPAAQSAPASPAQAATPATPAQPSRRTGRK